MVQNKYDKGRVKKYLRRWRDISSDFVVFSGLKTGT